MIIEHAKAIRERGVTQLMYVGTDDDVTVVANRNIDWVKGAKIGASLVLVWWLYKLGVRTRR